MLDLEEDERTLDEIWMRILLALPSVALNFLKQNFSVTYVLWS